MGAEQSCTSAFLWVAAAPRAIDELHDALLAVFAGFDVRPARMLISPRPGKTTAYNAARLATAMRSPDTTSVLVKCAGDVPVVVDLHLHDIEARLTKHLHRYVKLTTPPMSSDDPRVVRFLEVVCDAYAVIQGGMLEASHVDLAAAECSTTTNNRVEGDREKRLGFDAMNRREALHKLRRLYPVTIIGPAIWASLPPLPAVDPPLVVRDLADCKMVTAWPTLVDPHDLAFLLGTRELRRWLWPHTIQNPADDLATIDARLKWAELLPW